MSLFKAAVSSQVTWTQQSAIVGFVSAQQGPDKIYSSVGVDVTVSDEFYVYKGTLAISGTLVINLQSVTNLLNEAVSFTGIRQIILKTDGANITLAPSVTSPTTGLVWFFTGTTPVLTIKDGGTLLMDDGGFVTVDATHRSITITNTSASVTTYIELAIIGKTT